ncbi:MAG: 30S ribosomal protein S6 [Fusobacteriia bacterium 4572_74]|nr:MAG: 30S ribosomal protein S6 [Fusobacteriia bacterium 4572_74]
MTNYEIMYIINPTVMEDARGAIIEKVETILTAANATELKTTKMGERKLAYPIEKKGTGFYVLTTFKTEGQNLQAAENKLNITEEVMRYIIVKNK